MTAAKALAPTVATAVSDQSLASPRPAYLTAAKTQVHTVVTMVTNPSLAHLCPRTPPHTLYVFNPLIFMVPYEHVSSLVHVPLH